MYWQKVNHVGGNPHFFINQNKSMKHLLFTILTITLISSLSCQQANNTAKEAKPEPKVIEPEPKPEPEPEKPKEYQQGDLMGIWNVTMTATESTCEGTNVGDSKSETWTIESEAGVIKIRVSNNKNTGDSYNAKFLPQYNMLVGKGKDYDLFVTGDITLKLTMIEDNKMEGTREVIVSTPCKIEYKLTARKQ